MPPCPRAPTPLLRSPRARLAAAALAAGALLAAPATARAQSAEPDPEHPRVVAVENVLRPGAGRVPVTIEVTRTPHIEFGLADEPPAAVRRDASFATPRVPALCRAPCTLYLRPGPQRLVGDATSDFPWTLDTRAPATGALALRVRGHLLGLSALGGVSFILGLAGAVGGPAVIIISAIVGEPRLPVPLVVGGTIAAVAGGAMIAGAYALIGFAAPRIESRTQRPAPASATRAWMNAWIVAPVPLREGALLTAAIAF